MRVARDVQMIFKSSSTSKSSYNNNSRVHYSRELSHSGLYSCKKLLTQYNCVCSMQAIENRKEYELKIANFFQFLSVSVSVSLSCSIILSLCWCLLIANAIYPQRKSELFFSYSYDLQWIIKLNRILYCNVRIMFSSAPTYASTQVWGFENGINFKTYLHKTYTNIRTRQPKCRIESGAKIY